MSWEGTELLIHPRSARAWQVVERPATTEDSGSIPLDQVRTLVTAKSKELAVTWAEGRQSVTGQPIRMPGSY